MSYDAQYDAIKQVSEARVRLISGYVYMGWQWAGGPNECKHGYAEGIPCRECDTDTVIPKQASA